MKSLLYTFTIILLLFSSCGNESEISTLGEEGDIRFGKGDYKGALEIFDKIIELDSTNGSAHMRRADCLGELGDIYDAVKSYTRSLDLEPDNKLVFYNRALNYEELGETAKTISDYKSAIEVDLANEMEPNNSDIFLNLGIRYGENKQLNNAIISFSKAIQIDSEYAYAYYNRGYALQLLGRHEEATKDFDKAILMENNAQNIQFYKDLKAISEGLLGKFKSGSD